MKKPLLSLLLAACTAVSAGAQSSTDIHFNGHPQCGFDKVLQKVGVTHPDLVQAYRDAARSSAGASAKQTGIVYNIPVVFHVVTSAANPTFNVHDSVLRNQLDVLNRAFRKKHRDTGSVRSMFKNISGDAEIQFHFATKDPAGAPSTGITRTLSTRAWFGDATGDLDSMERIKHAATGGKNGWPANRYLNIWVGNLTSGTGQLAVLGYATPPLNPLPPNWDPSYAAALAGMGDGVVMQVHGVGSNNPLSPALQGIYTQGRALVHEVGHYLGLQHVFGGNGGGTPSCGVLADDGINDTPVQSEYSFDANSGTSCPLAVKNTCGSGSADMPDLWENYMDYTRDACQTMFTKGQISLMRSVVGNQRAGLNTSAPAAVLMLTQQSTLGLYPNPATGRIFVEFGGSISRISVLNFLGQKMLQLEGRAADAKQYDISALPAGNYLMVLEAEGALRTEKFSIK